MSQKTGRRRAAGWGLVCLCASVLAACGGKSALEQKAAATQSQPLAVTVTPAAAEQLPLTMAATGSFVADESAEIGPEVEGLVTQTPVRIGDFVVQGAPIVVLSRENAALQLKQMEAAEQEALAALKQAEARIGQSGSQVDLQSVPEVRAAQAAHEAALADLRLARTEAERDARLAESGDLPRANYDRSRAAMLTAEARAKSAQQQYQAALNAARQGAGGVEAARAALAAARARLALARKTVNDAVIRAPFAGYVSARSVSAGEYVTTATKLATLEKIQPLRLHLQVPEAEAAKLKLGQTVRASLQAYPGETFQGRITAVNAAVNPASRSIMVEATFANADLRLKPGMFATAEIEQGGAQEVVALPRAAVQEDNRTDSFRAWVAEGGRARLRVVQVARQRDAAVLIVAGVKAGESVITSDLTRLFDGAPIATK